MSFCGLSVVVVCGVHNCKNGVKICYNKDKNTLCLSGYSFSMIIPFTFQRFFFINHVILWSLCCGSFVAYTIAKLVERSAINF